MHYVIIEFVADIAPCIAEIDWPLTKIADRLGLNWLDLQEQVGPVIGSTLVWHKGEPVAIYREMPSLRDFM